MRFSAVPASRRKSQRKELPMAKSYEELQFTDDFMFGKVMEDKELCRDVLECLLQEPVGTLVGFIQLYF